MRTVLIVGAVSVTAAAALIVLTYVIPHGRNRR